MDGELNCWRGTTGRAAVVRSVGSVGFRRRQVAASRKDPVREPPERGSSPEPSEMS